MEEELGVRGRVKKRSKESGAVVRQIREKEGKGRREEGGRAEEEEDNTWTIALKYLDTSVYF